MGEADTNLTCSGLMYDVRECKVSGRYPATGRSEVIISVYLITHACPTPANIPHDNGGQLVHCALKSYSREVPDMGKQF